MCENIAKLISAQNIHIHIDLIAGLPLENYESFKESFNKAYSLKPHMLQLGFLKFLHGSDLKENPYGAVYSINPPYEVIHTPYISENELKLLHVAEKSLDMLYSSGRFLETAEYMMQELNLLPYDFYFETGKLLENAKTPMEACEVLLNYGTEKGLNKEKLRDILAFDWLSKSPKLPPCLYIADRNLKKLHILLDEDISTRREKNVKRSVLIMYSKNKAGYFDYLNPDKITGRYEFKETEFID